MIFLLILRNLLRNKKNSLIVLLLISVITALFFVGNSVIGQSHRGLRATYVENLTGDLVVQRSGEVSMNLFGANTPIIDEFFSIPTLPAYERIREIVSTTPGVAEVSSQISAMAVLDLAGVREPVPLCGIDPESYFSLFPGISLEAGEFLAPGRRGAMLTQARVRSLESRTGETIAIGDPVLLTTAGGTGFRIREVPLVGIFSYQSPGQFMDQVILIDPQTTRALSEVLVATDASDLVDLPEEASRLLSGTETGGIDELFGDSAESGDLLDQSGAGESGNLDDLFGSSEGGESGDFSGDSAASTPVSPATGDSAAENLGGFQMDQLRQRLQRDAGSEPEQWTGGDWNFILLRSDPGTSDLLLQQELNRRLAGYDVRVVGWRTAAGGSALIVLLLQSLFNAGVILVGIAGIIAMVNILLIAVFRRTREIGTLRALGASDWYIRALIFGENVFLSFLAGSAGVGFGARLLAYINAKEIPLDNPLLASLFGGSVIQVDFAPDIALGAVALAAMLGLLASLYPVQAAVRIHPIVAVRKG